uniref:C2H2-type domain-containing protein n=1 Tax=Esox lucius TaxID=8010 RepID=A0AAY5KRY2_ESOLU
MKAEDGTGNGESDGTQIRNVSPGQIVTSESSLPAVLSQPVIRGPPDNPVAVLSRVTPSMNPVTPLTPFSAASSTPKQPIAEESSNALPVNSPLITRSSESDPDPQSLSTEEKQMVTTPNRSPPTNASLLTHPQSPSMTFDPSIEAVNQSTAPESERSSLPWNDHLYFSSTAPPSPPLVTVVPSGTPRNLEPLDPLDLVSPGSPPSTGPRRVLYCPLCPRIFYYVSDLERHSITHSQNKPHVCLQCGKAFKRSSHLQRHNHIHTGQRNFVCPICSKRFREAGELQRHQRVHTGEKPYQCSLCHTRFAERNTLRRHTKRKHPYHQAAVDMLTEGGDGRGAGEGEEETEEWYSSTVSNLENSDSEPDSEVIS